MASNRPLLEAQNIGAWWDIKLLEKKGKQYRVHYEKFSREEDEDLPSNMIRLRSRKAKESDCSLLGPQMDILVFCVHPQAFRSESKLSQNSAWYDAKIISKNGNKHYCGCSCKFYVQLYTGKGKLLERTLEVRLGKICILQVPCRGQVESVLQQALSSKQWASQDSFSLQGLETLDPTIIDQALLTCSIKKRFLEVSSELQDSRNLMENGVPNCFTKNANDGKIDSISTGYSSNADSSVSFGSNYDVGINSISTSLIDWSQSTHRMRKTRQDSANKQMACSHWEFDLEDAHEAVSSHWLPENNTNECMGHKDAYMVSEDMESDIGTVMSFSSSFGPMINQDESFQQHCDYECRSTDSDETWKELGNSFTSSGSFHTMEDNQDDANITQQGDSGSRITLLEKYPNRKFTGLKKYTKTFQSLPEVMEDWNERPPNKLTKNPHKSVTNYLNSCQESPLNRVLGKNVGNLTARKARTNNQKHSKSSTVEGKGNEIDELFDEIIMGIRKKEVTDWTKLQKQAQEDIKYNWDPLVFNELTDSDAESSEEENLDPLKCIWEDMQSAARLLNNPHTIEEMHGDLAVCEHSFVHDEEEGLMCRFCGFISISIENIYAPISNRLTPKRCNNDYQSSEEKSDNFSVNLEDENQLFDAFTKPDCTMVKKSISSVWTLIPDLQPCMKVHQIEGFKFLWRNLAGGLGPDGGENEPTNSEIGGCIISHAPGTGKSFLIISFLKSFMALNSWCRPLIVAPKSMLLPWQKEFEKWKVNIPVHVLKASGGHYLYYLKTISVWQKEESVLIMSYCLFTSLTSERNAWRTPESWKLGKLLLYLPGMLILDEGHVPRNGTSKVRKSLLQVHTKLRILVSGTLFQNNVQELFNCLYLVRPNFSDGLEGPPYVRSHSKDRSVWDSFQDFQNRQDSIKSAEEAEARARKAFMERIGCKLQKDSCSEDHEFKSSRKRFRDMTDSFIHRYSGDVLNALPGIHDFTIILNVSSLQEQILEQLKKNCDASSIEKELIETAIGIHPSLISEFKFTKKYQTIDFTQLHDLRRDPWHGTKVQFIMLLADCCQSYGEKLLIFSQHTMPLTFLQEILQEKFKVFLIQGSLTMEERQKVIDTFNADTKDTMIILASIKACGEGISLTGASRVVFLDMLWNPSSTKQAISRAFRLGQQKVVYVYRLIAKRKMEQEKYRRILKKDWLSRAIFTLEHAAEDGPKAQSTNIRGEDFMLDEVLNRDTNKNILNVFKHDAFLEKGKLFGGFELS